MRRNAACEFFTKPSDSGDTIQPQAVTDHRYAAERHCQCRHHGMQLPEHDRKRCKRMQNARGNRDQDNIVKKCPEQILPDGGHGASAEPDGPGDAGKTAAG